MRILFLLMGPGRRFERVIADLESHGHEVHVAVPGSLAGFEELLERLCERHPGITCGVAPKRDDRWVALAEALGLGVDYLRYLSPEYASAPRLRARAAHGAPAKVLRVTGWPLVRTRAGSRVLGGAMRWLEASIPDDPGITEYLRSQRPDLLLISPLVTTPSQAHYVRAARSLGIRSALLVWSWDNLTNKGLIRDVPNRVYVWNEYQRREAIKLHGVPEERVVATGAYPWDHWFEWKPSTTPEQFRERLDFPADRPIILYVCSSRFVAPDEPAFVERWLGTLREHADERVRTASVVIRPHPKARDPWWDSGLARTTGVAVWPLDEPGQGKLNLDDESRSAYFDSIHHSSAVVGLNTSALIEAAILERPVFTVLDPGHSETQEGTLHFHYLPRDNGGPLTVANDFTEHFAQLGRALSRDRQPDPNDREFVRRFVRPNGLDRPAVPVMVQALDDQLASPPPRPALARTRRAVASIGLRPLAALATRSVRPRRKSRRRDRRGMRILFVLTGPARRFERMLHELASRGHEVHVAVRSEDPGYEGVIERVHERHPAVTCGAAPVREDRWVALAEALGLGVDYLRFLSPEYADSPELQARAARWAPTKVVRLSKWPLVRSQTGIRALAWVMRRLEDAIPDSPQITDFIRFHRPDLVMVSPLVAIPSQTYYLRAARSLGIRSALLVSSWDNLTNKGLIRELPDRVYVWNEDQCREAIELHGVPEARLVATGAYSFDHWFGWRRSTSAEEFCARLGLDPKRPTVLYACSSAFVARDERPFVERWVEAMRQHQDERLRTANLLIRPHPGFRDYPGARDPWCDSPLKDVPGVAVWPLEGGFNRDDESRSDYFDSIHHSSAVVGLNTSSLIEAAILGRPVFTVLDAEYRDTQEGTLHFHYLPRGNGGPVTVGRDFNEHFGHLAGALANGRQSSEADRDFVHRFIRPHGLDRPAVPILVGALEDQMDDPAPCRAPARVRRAIAAVVLCPLAFLADRAVRSRPTTRPHGRDGRREAPAVLNGMATLRAALWAFRAAAIARRQLRNGSLDQLRLPQAPAVPVIAERGVAVGLRLGRATCLVSAAVRQRWHLAQGLPRAIVVGVARPSGGFQAHAWLEGDPRSEAQTYEELLRHPAT